MTNSVSISLLPQFVETTSEVFKERRLHKIQSEFLNYESLEQFTIITAPTGTGKSFAFPLPVIQHKRKNSFSERRCVIVSPTNALIEDMAHEYNKLFPELKICKLNRVELDKLHAKGPARWDALLEILKENDVIITNPDILSFVLLGGYIRHKGQHEITKLFTLIEYFVFDEYHLYDEEQIANIVSWIVFGKTTCYCKTKFIFASATVEEGLAEVLKRQGFEPKEIIEKISDQQTPTSRSIHGKIDVTFLKDITPQNFLLENSKQIWQWIKSGERILVIFDKMVDLRKARIDIENEFRDVAIAEESGYFTKSTVREDTTNAKIILGTNKVEVGVNLNVTICLMQTGKYFANFIQRFGRVARGAIDGKVIIFLENKIKPIEKAFVSCSAISYYEFIGRCRKIELLSDEKFYSEKVAQYLGAYFYIIYRNLKDYNTRKLFNSNLKLEGQTKFMHSLLYKIETGIKHDLWRANKSCGYGYSSDFSNWKKWWDLFTSTFKSFRASTKDVSVRDLTYKTGNIITKYSLEWILKNREIVSIEKIGNEPCYVVSGFLEGKTELRYYIESMPIYKLSEDTLYLMQSEKYDLKKAFEKRLYQIADQMYKNGDFFRVTARQLLFDIIKLKPLFTEKRLVITDIRSFSNII